MELGNSLAVLGIAEEEELAFEAIIGRAAMGLDELADRWSDLATTRVEVRVLLGRLEELGLIDVVVGQPNRYRAARAGHVLAGLALARERALLDARSRIDALDRTQAESGEDTTPGELLEVVQGRRAIYQRAESLIRDAVRQVRCIDRPPYANHVENRESPEEAERLGSGVQVRGVYDVKSFDAPGKARSVGEAVRLGEQARVMAGAPVKLLICDNRLALLPFRASTTLESALVVHPCALLDVLIALFESCWQTATPFGGAPNPPHGEPSTRDARHILPLMAMGMSDQAMAQNLGIGLRTLQQRLSDMLAETGASTRFELALIAVGAGWVSPRRGLKQQAGPH